MAPNVNRDELPPCQTVCIRAAMCMQFANSRVSCENEFFVHHTVAVRSHAELRTAVV